jgi:hypothetical protein
VYHAVMNGRYPDMDNRQELWQLPTVSDVISVTFIHKSGWLTKRVCW